VVKVPGRDELFTIADQLVQCCRTQLVATEAGVPDRTCVVPGSDLVWDECECGLLAVQTLRTYPSESFPIIKQTKPFNCAVPLTVVEYKVSILRCVAQAAEGAEAPTCAAMQDDAITDLQDRWAVLRGVHCCLAPRPLPYLVQEQLAIGEGGMCAGSELHVLVALGNCVECP
jgi:hypothetical protein